MGMGDHRSFVGASTLVKMQMHVLYAIMCMGMNMDG